MKKRRNPQRPFRAALDSHDVLAMHASALSIEHDVPEIQESADQSDGIAVVCIGGPLAHRSSWLWDSYDDIAERIDGALAEESVRAVVLRIDSPGGEANGCIELHRKIRSLRREYGKPVYAYSDESAYSAAYAIASAADEVWLPETGGAGSIGVIAPLTDQTEALKKAGVKIRLITTGARKADGNPNQEMTEDVIEALQARVDALGDAFMSIVAESRGMSVDAVRALEAGCFTGQSAVDAGLADGVAGWDEFISMVGESISSRAMSVRGDGTAHTESSTMKARKLGLIKARDAAKASLLSAKTDEEKTKLLAAYEQAMLALAKAEDESAEDEDEQAEGEEEESSEDEQASDDEESAEDEQAEGEDEDEEEDEKASAKAGIYSDNRLFRLAKQLTGQKSRREVFGALEAMGARLAAATKMELRLAKLEGESKRSKVDAMLAKAKREGRITPAQVDSLRAQGLKDPKWLAGHLAVLPKAVRTTEDGPVVGIDPKLAAYAPDAAPRATSSAAAVETPKSNFTSFVAKPRY